jgi:nicotinate-nucleotide adenylyltransferase
MGGTFNPIHYGHLVTAQEALDQFNLERVIFIPTGEPPHKTSDRIAPPNSRYIMTVIATASNPCFFVSRFEIERTGKSYTIDTLRELKSTYGDDIQLYFITGADAILEILTWKDTEEIMTLCKFIAATRPGYDLSRLEDLKNKLLKASIDPGEKKEKERAGILEKIENTVLVMEVPALAISSTDIRNRIRKKRTIEYLLPEGVANYILKHGLYQ